MADDPLSVRFEMRATERWVQKLDCWRGGQQPIPSRAEAIRRLVSQGLVGKAQGRTVENFTIEAMMVPIVEFAKRTGADPMDVLGGIITDWARENGQSVAGGPAESKYDDNEIISDDYVGV